MEQLNQILERLNGAGVEYVLVGGLAAVFHGVIDDWVCGADLCSTSGLLCICQGQCARRNERLVCCTGDRSQLWPAPTLR